MKRFKIFLKQKCYSMSPGQKKNCTGTVSLHWPVPKVYIVKRSLAFPRRPGHSLSVLLSQCSRQPPLMD